MTSNNRLTSFNESRRISGVHRMADAAGLRVEALDEDGQFRLLDRRSGEALKPDHPMSIEEVVAECKMRMR